ncbi:T9SS type A sorting domain-containing protein, partial [candidate division KSB1 bacterium]|nr:T9SS type A sorting domain-containing protein [candidate division KSB1 bacterium]
GGAHWDLQTSNKIENLLGIDFIGTGGVCVVGDYETVLITNDDGQTWRPIPSETHSLNAFNDVYFLDDRYGWIGGGWGSEAVLLQTEDSGETWIERDVTSYEFKDYNSYGQVDDNPNLGSLQQIYFYDRTTAIGLFESDSREISQYGNIAMNTEDGGESWFVMVHGSNEDYAGKGRFSILDENNVICTGYYGDFCFSENRGKEWYYADDRPRWWTDLVVGKNGQLLTSQYCNRYGWEEGDFTGYLRSSDYGSTWREYLPRYLDKNGQPIPNDNPFLFGFGDFISNNRDTLWLVQFIPRDEEPMSLTAFISTDFGLTYKEIRRGLNGHVNRFLTPDTMIGYTTYQIEISMGNFDTGFEFYCSFDGGETVHTYKSRNIWNKLTFTMWGMIQKLEINAHYFLNGHKGFIVGSDGNIIGTDDTGQSWTNIYSGVVEDLWDITFIDEKTGFVVGDFGRILKTVDGGKIWYKTNSRTQEDIFCIGFLNDREGWVGTENGLRYTTDAGETWNGVPLRYSHGPLRKIAFDDQGNSYAYTDQFSSFEENLPGSYDHLLRMLNNPTGVQKRASESDKPYTMLLSQNYPNPFNSSTQIEYVIPQPALVSLQIYNLQGQLVTTLVNETKESGYFSVTWNGCSDSGTPVSTGVYIYHLQCNDQIKTRKLLLLK